MEFWVVIYAIGIVIWVALPGSATLIGIAVMSVACIGWFFTILKENREAKTSRRA